MVRQSPGVLVQQVVDAAYATEQRKKEPSVTIVASLSTVADAATRFLLPAGRLFA